ncbi:MAG: zinc-ribbon domain-containing protein [Faecousia sp.]
MYCYNCGKEISETVNFCPYCGAEQRKKPHDKDLKGNHGGGNSPWLSRVFIGLAVIFLVIVGLLAVRAMLGKAVDAQNGLEETAAAESAAEDTKSEDGLNSEEQRTDVPVTTESQIPEDGWHTVNGDRYYIRDGQKYVDIQEIDGELYYFDEDGVLAVNKDVRYGELILHSDRYGCIEGLTIEELFGTWAEEVYRFGNGGSSSVLELSTEVENCDSFRFCLEATGLHGARVNGTWKIYIRHAGKWEFVQNIDYTQPKGNFDIEFEMPKTFDAITAYPTVQGNASYSSLFYLQNVHCII